MADVEALRAQLRSGDLAEMVEALVEIGRKNVRALEPEVARLLDHEDPEVRAEALRVLCFYWRLDAYAEAATRLLDDEDEEVRAVALLCLGELFRGTKDAAELSRLARILRDREEETMVRAQAYRSLLAVAGVPPAEMPRKLDAFQDLDAEVDWALVDRLAG